MARKTVGELEDELKRKDERIEELRAEVDEQRDLIKRMEEHADNYVNTMESWKESFGMEQTERGTWTWEPFWDEHDQLIADYNDLVRRWNKYLPKINGDLRNVGRPLAASETQVEQVLQLRKQGYSLRGIADETSLGLNTIRTIVAKKNGNDRTTTKHRRRLEERIDLEQIPVNFTHSQRA